MQSMTVLVRGESLRFFSACPLLHCKHGRGLTAVSIALAVGRAIKAVGDGAGKFLRDMPGCVQRGVPQPHAFRLLVAANEIA